MSKEKKAHIDVKLIANDDQPEMMGSINGDLIDSTMLVAWCIKAISDARGLPWQIIFLGVHKALEGIMEREKAGRVTGYAAKVDSDMLKKIMEGEE